MFSDMLIKFDQHLQKLSPGWCFAISIFSSCIFGVIDYLAGTELSFSIFYTLPIMFVAWYGSTILGIVVSIVSAGIWLGANIAAGSEYFGWGIPVWNTMVRLIYFLIIVTLLDLVHKKLQLEESLADTDTLTDLWNRRFFEEQLEREIVQFKRKPDTITIVYFDLDNFKYVNDSMGHHEGDKLLQKVSQTLLHSIRKADFAARIGGDEFAILFPALSTENRMPIISKLSSNLTSAMLEMAWPVTFSIGVVTFNKMMDSNRDMVKFVDNLMYSVKKSGKNKILYAEWP